MTAALVALMAGRVVGTVTRDTRGQLRFTYDDGWRAAPGAYPLSLSMPLAVADHPHDRIEAFLWGLLPDNAHILDRWAKRFQVSARNAFALVAHVGEDCAGAVQFARPERIGDLTTEGPRDVAWLTEAEIAERLRLLRTDPSAWRTSGDTGQFSLAGAQPKTALLLEDGRWGVPAGRTPTTHILKPPSADLDGHAGNEHICLRLARAMGLIATRSEVRRFEREAAIVVERYDRRQTAGGIVRVHQEDVCQALAVLPTSKYETEGGPGARAVMDLLGTASSRPDEDRARFVDALIFNWLIAGTDAHAKNYSLLIGANGRVRLAPLYDVASALPYGRFDPQKLRLAMKIGGAYRLRDIGARQWRRLGDTLRIDPDALVARAAALAEMLPDHLADVRRQAGADGLDHRIVERLAADLSARAGDCRRQLSAPSPASNRAT